MLKKECPICKKIFIPSRKEGVYCSHQCYGKSIKGIFKTLEHRKKLSLSFMGRPSPLKGKHHSIEANTKNRIAHLGKKHSLETRIKMSQSRSGENHYHWKGGKRGRGKGYICIYCPEHPFNRDRYVYEHRIVMEKYLGRYLTEKEVVHHINGIKTDNRIENLQLFSSKGEHRRFHMLNKK